MCLSSGQASSGRTSVLKVVKPPGDADSQDWEKSGFIWSRNAALKSSDSNSASKGRAKLITRSLSSSGRVCQPSRMVDI
jgi:hypothetical protein